ncbi:Rieske (2Fe-2S) protein [Porphyromonas crevioricanis]|uniref:Rieske domain-containing protein n=1 Tax=Porphyromonas crevioricanis JCM 15906 TaxID=1305617 RepID=T1DSJ1_9PORP|nr:hypothetical protein [Porphyromonas crevioricanis]GAD05289.1 hypothetical protein PORCRE_989 [Porphyromonas crevioricanis JCM 15906]GAD06633.1 hypothetical protein PORCAN_231 [Porphyromonas crevioricanis JCM 13913]
MLRSILHTSALSLLLLWGLVSCSSRQESSIPSVPVYYELYFNSVQGSLLFSPGSALEVRRPETIVQSIGVSGLLIVHSIVDAGVFYAFDLCCPYEAEPEISVCLTDALEVTCPYCHSVYSVLYGNGAPVAGPSSEPLRRYRVEVFPDRLVVIN